MISRLKRKRRCRCGSCRRRASVFTDANFDLRVERLNRYQALTAELLLGADNVFTMPREMAESALRITGLDETEKDALRSKAIEQSARYDWGNVERAWVSVFRELGSWSADARDASASNELGQPDCTDARRPNAQFGSGARLQTGSSRLRRQHGP